MVSELLSEEKITIEIPEPEKVFTKVFERIWGIDSRFVINKGGTGSSKSFSAAQKEVLISCERKVTTLVIRKVAATLKDSVIPSFKNRISEFGLSTFHEENKSERTITNTVTGSVFLFRGLDDPEKLKSIEGIDRILIEEATELDREDFLELNRRVRGRDNIQITLNFNPIHEKHWLKKHFFDEGVEDCAIIESTYKDNQFLTDKDRAEIEYLKKYNYNQYRIYALGDWGITEIDNPWLFAFSQDRHVSANPLKLIPDMPVHLSFDFNINPMTCIAMQHSKYYGQGAYIRILKEFELHNTNVKEACKVIKAAFPYSVLTATGDATGRNRNAGYTSGNETLWSQVQRGLKLSDAQLLVPKVNPSHRNSRFLCNILFQEHPSILIDPSCKGLIADCQTARPIETDNQEKEDQLLKGAGDSEIGYNLFDCLRYALHTHHHQFAKSPLK